MGTDSAALRNAVTVSRIMTHETALQAIASANPVDGVPTRAAGTPGYRERRLSPCPARP
jgi:hypothetical protein